MDIKKTICIEWTFTECSESRTFQEHFQRLMREDESFRKAVNGMSDIGEIAMNVRSGISVENERLREKKAEVYASPRWKDFRLWIIAKRGGKCEKCSSESNLHVHHLTYENLGEEQGKDVQVLCQKCHFAVHKKRGVIA